MKLLKLIGFVLAAFVTAPLWPVGFVLAWLHWALGEVIRWGFWVPCRWAGSGMVQSWRALRAAEPEVQRVATAEGFKRRARRAMRGR